MSGRRKDWSPEMAYIVVREHGYSGNFIVCARGDWRGGPIHGYAATRKEALKIARERLGELDDRITLELMEAREAEAREKQREAREARLVALGYELPTAEQRAQNLREITDHLLHGSGKTRG